MFFKKNRYESKFYFGKSTLGYATEHSFYEMQTKVSMKDCVTQVNFRPLLPRGELDIMKTDNSGRCVTHEALKVLSCQWYRDSETQGKLEVISGATV